MKSARTILCLSVLVGLGSGCASFVTDDNQQLVFNSDPNKADVFVNGTKSGTTPCNILVKRSKPPPPIVIKKEGYEDSPVVFTSKLNPWVIGNFLWGWCSTTAFAIDMQSDKSLMYYPDTFLTTLTPLVDSTNTQSVAKAEVQKEKSKVVRYIVANYDLLTSDISRGKGDFLATLYELLKVPSEKQEAAAVKIKELFIKYDEPSAFARAIELEFPLST